MEYNVGDSVEFLHENKIVRGIVMYKDNRPVPDYYDVVDTLNNREYPKVQKNQFVMTRNHIFSKHVCVTGHRTGKILKFLSENNISKQQFIEAIEKTIEEQFTSKEYVFHLGGSDGFDNIVGYVIAKMGYSYEMYVPYFDVNGRSYWDQDQHRIYQLLKHGAKRFHRIDGNYIARDHIMQDKTTNLFAFMQDPKSGTGKTITFWDSRTKRMPVSTVNSRHFIIKKIELM